MKYISRFTKPEALEALNDNPVIRQLMQELNAVFGWAAYGLYNHYYVTVTTEDGVYVGMINAKAKINGDNEAKTEYQFISPIVKKDRGRGMDRMTRASNSLKLLIKAIKRDLPTAPFERFYPKKKVDDIRETLSRRYSSQNRNFPLVSSELAEILKFEANPTYKSLTLSHTLDKIKKFVSEREAEDKASEEAKSVFSEAYVFCVCDNEPMSFGKIKLNDNKQYEFTEPMKSYLSLEELPVEFLVQYKMWRTARETQHGNLDKEILPRIDHVDEEFDTMHYYDHRHMFLQKLMIVGLNVN
jgi:hypothetical protein